NPSSNRTCGFPASGSPGTSRLRHSRGVDGASPQPGEPQTRERLIPTLSLRARKAPLAPAAQMLLQPIPHVPVHPSERAARIPLLEVVPPSHKHPVHLPDHLLHRLIIIPARGQFVELGAHL